MLLKDRSELDAVWDSLKAAAAANPDVPTVLLLVAQDVDALSTCAMLTVRARHAPAAPAPRGDGLVHAVGWVPRVRPLAAATAPHRAAFVPARSACWRRSSCHTR